MSKITVPPVDVPRLARMFPAPWSFDTSLQETPPNRKCATIYAADSTRICTTRGEDAGELARMIVEAVNHCLAGGGPTTWRTQ